jgi:hypothetical protein
LGLLVCELHLAGDWSKLRAWLLEKKTTGQDSAMEAVSRGEA